MYKNMEQNNTNDKTKENYHTVTQYDNNGNQYFYRKAVNQQVEPPSTALLLLMFVIYLVLGMYAARLSWYANSKAGWSQGYKVLFAIIAFMFPVTYITVHIIFKMDLLQKIRGGSKSLY